MAAVARAAISQRFDQRFLDSAGEFCVVRGPFLGDIFLPKRGRRERLFRARFGRFGRTFGRTRRRGFSPEIVRFFPRGRQKIPPKFRAFARANCHPATVAFRDFFRRAREHFFATKIIIIDLRVQEKHRIFRARVDVRVVKRPRGVGNHRRGFFAGNLPH